MTRGAIADTATSRRIVEDMYAAAGRMDFPAMLSYVADDLVLREPALLPYGNGNVADMTIFFHEARSLAAPIP